MPDQQAIAGAPATASPSTANPSTSSVLPASDFVDNPSYQAPQGPLAASDFVDNPSYQSTQTQPSVHGGDAFMSNVQQGMAHELANTASGALDLVKKPLSAIAPNFVNKAEDVLGTMQGNGVMQDDSAAARAERAGGRTAETLSEFLMGDEALKGLSFADKMTQVAKVAKVLEKSPRTLEALQRGAELAKVQGELSPDELALIQAHPRLAKLASLGAEALRHGVVQGAQSFVKSGGNVKEASKDAGEMALTSGVTGGVLGSISGAASKTGNAAETSQALSEAAKNAPTAEGVRADIENYVNEALNPEREAAAKGGDAAKRDLGEFATDAPSKENLTEAAQNYAQQAEEAYHGAYRNGVAGLKADLAGETIPYKDSPLHQAAQELVQQGQDEAKPLDQGFRKTRPGSPALNARLDFLANPDKPIEAAEAEPSGLVDANGRPIPAQAPEPEEPAPIDLDINELISRRKELGEQLRNTGWSTDMERQDRGIYKRMIQGVDDTIQQLAENASAKANEAIANGEQPLNPNAANVLNRYKAINNAYRQSSRVFENKDVKAILEGRHNDVMQRLMSGGTSVNDINAVKQAFGDQLYHRFATDSLQRFAADSIDDQGNVNYKGLLQKWNRIKPEVREAAFGKFSADTFNNVLNGAVGADEKLRSVNNTLSNLMSSADPSTLMKSPERLNELESVIGPDAMNEVGKSIVQSKIREASTTLDPKTGQTVMKFDPDKFLSWVMSLKDNPEIADRLFRSTPETQAKFDKLLKSVSDVKTQKRLNALGIGGASTVAGVAAAPAHAFATVLAAMVGTHELGESSVRKVLDRVANSPAIWKALGGVSDVTQKAAANPTGKAVAAKAIYSAAKNALASGHGGGQ